MTDDPGSQAVKVDQLESAESRRARTGLLAVARPSVWARLGDHCSRARARLTGRQRFLHILCPPGGGDIEIPEDHVDSVMLHDLFGMIVYQAMDDGMTAVSFGVDRQTGGSWLKYLGPGPHAASFYGPGSYAATIYKGEPVPNIWWDMVPPPPVMFPAALQWLLSLAKLELDLPIRGQVPARLYGRRLLLQLDVPESNELQLSGFERFFSKG